MLDYKRFIVNLFKKTKSKRVIFFVFADSILIIISLYLSLWLRFEGNIPAEYFPGFFYYLVMAVLIKICILALFKVYRFSWSLFGLREAVWLMVALAVSFVAFGSLVLLTRNRALFSGFPRGALLADFVFTTIFLGGLRIGKRFFREIITHRDSINRIKKRILIIGAGEAGVQLTKEMIHNPSSLYQPVGFIDDDRAKKGLLIQGVHVIGGRELIKNAIEETKAEEILIAIPSAPSKELRKIVEEIRKASQNVPIKIVPSILNIFNGHISISQIDEIKVEDLLGREQVEIDYGLLRKFLEGKKIIITGAGGSIGSEVVRQCLRFKPESLLALDIDETELFMLEKSIDLNNCNLRMIVGDIRDRFKVSRLFKEFKPEFVIHAAAYKHVPILEEFPEEAIKTNIFGTRILAEEAISTGVDKFINISTDKAINPTSVMGVSKRVAEELLRVMNEQGRTRFISVRFGNVLGSRGSVIPLFKEQIKRGGPITITHPEMKRYFMTISEAVLLVLEAAAIGSGGETFVLDMGEPVKVEDIAREMIRLSGKEPDVDIAIVYTGLRPGEKLFEEILGAEEGSESTGLPKIFKARSRKSPDLEHMLRKINELVKYSSDGLEKKELIAIFKELVPTYNPSELKGLD